MWWRFLRWLLGSPDKSVVRLAPTPGLIPSHEIVAVLKPQLARRRTWKSTASN